MTRTVETDQTVTYPATPNEIHTVLGKAGISLVGPDEFMTPGVNVRSYRQGVVWVTVNQRTAGREELAIRITRILARHNYAMRRSGSTVRVDGKHTT